MNRDDSGSCYCIIEELPKGRRINISGSVVFSNDNYYGTNRTGYIIGFKRQATARREFKKMVEHYAPEWKSERLVDYAMLHNEVMLLGTRMFIVKMTVKDVLRVYEKNYPYWELL